jgi:predicted nucleotidyltransferase component of viral defense system
MLDNTIVYDAFPGIPDAFKRAILREYLQYKTLQFIFRAKESGGLVFMGGTALRVFYGSRRFSEDIDFDSNDISSDDLRRIALTAVNEFKLEANYTPQVKVLNRLDVIVPVSTASAELILAQKLYAILNRRRIMGRDLYDASFLFGFTEPDMDYLEQKVHVSSKNKIEELILNRFGERSIDELARDIEPFVPGMDDLLRVKLFPEILRSWAGV